MTVGRWRHLTKTLTTVDDDWRAKNSCLESSVDRTVLSGKTHFYSQNAELFRRQITVKVDHRIFQLFSGLGRVKVVSSTQCQLLRAVRLPRSRTYCRRRTNNRANTILFADICYDTTTRGHLRTIADSVAQSTRRRHWPVADVTAPIPCRRVWPVAASTVCRRPVVTFRFSRRRQQRRQPSRHRDAARYAVFTPYILACLLIKLNFLLYSHFPGQFLS